MKKRIQKNKAGFTIVELMVVVAIIAIISAIAISQYNKFKGNAALSNVQGMCKQLAKSAMSLGSSAQQNPACICDSVVAITYAPATGIMTATGTAGTPCDTVNTGVLTGTPVWVQSISATGLTVNTNGTATGAGVITVVSTYTYGGNTLACNYNPATDTLNDATGGKCHL